MAKPRHIEMKIVTYEGKDSWRTVHPMQLTVQQEERIRVIWEDATSKIKAIIKEANGGSLSGVSEKESA